MRKKFWEKLKEEGRSFIWFFNRFVKDKTDLSYNTIYQQAKGDILKNMSPELESAINIYLGQNG